MCARDTVTIPVADWIWCAHDLVHLIWRRIEEGGFPATSSPQPHSYVPQCTKHHCVPGPLLSVFLLRFYIPAMKGIPKRDISLASSQGSPPFSRAASNCHSELKRRLLWNFWLLPFRSGNIVKSDTGYSVQLKDPRCLELKADSSSRDSEKTERSLAQAENHVCTSRYCLPVCNGLSAYWLPWEVVNQWWGESIYVIRVFLKKNVQNACWLSGKKCLK